MTSTPLPARPSVRKRKGFVEKTIKDLADAMERATYADDLAQIDGLLQRLDPRVKVVGLLSMVVAVAISRNILVIIAFFGIALIMALLSHVPIRTLVSRVWIGALFFTGTLVAPAIFITPGQSIFQVPLLGWHVTAQGIGSAAYMITRVETTATLAILLILCTPWTHVLKALRVLGIPVVFVVILGMTWRYIYLMLQIASNMFESRQSRMVGNLDGPERRRLAAASVGVLLGKTMQLSNDVFMAMQARGFRGEVYTMDEFTMQPNDWIALGVMIALAVIASWLGR